MDYKILKEMMKDMSTQNELFKPGNYWKFYEKNIIKSTPWGQMTYLDYKKKIEFGNREFDEISRYCKKVKIDWFCSPWDINSLKFLKKYKLKYNKVASAMITNTELLHGIAKEKKLTFISTGMCSMKDVKLAVKIFKND